MKNSMMLSRENPPNIYFSITNTQYSTYPTVYSNGYKIMKVPHTPFQASPTWALNSVSQLATDLALGLAFGESEEVLYSYGMQGSMNIVSRISGTVGTVEWTYGLPYVSVSTS